MNSILMTVVVLISNSAFALTCKTAGSGETIRLEITETSQNRDHFTDETYEARIDIFEVNGAVVNKSFTAKGTLGMMPAGEMTEMQNKDEGFFYKEGFNGSELNGWLIPETILYQNIEYSSCNPK